jgi:hypothetical protein
MSISNHPLYLYYLDNDLCREQGVSEMMLPHQFKAFNILKLIVKDLTHQRHSEKRQKDIEQYILDTQQNPQENDIYQELKLKVLPHMMRMWNYYREKGGTIKHCNKMLK